jgi:hypothetical protein
VSGCLRRVGCLVIVLLLIAAAYLYREGWLGFVRGTPAGDTRAVTKAASAEGTWASLTPEGATRARTAVQSLGRRSGPVFVTLEASDVASYIFSELGQQLPASADSVQATARGDRLYLRASVPVKELGGKKALGPVGAFLGDQEPLELGGTFDVLRPGLAQFRVRELKLRELALPAPLIPRIITQIRRGTVPEGVSPDGLPLKIPDYIGDVRVSRGRVVLYKNVQ